MFPRRTRNAGGTGFARALAVLPTGTSPPIDAPENPVTWCGYGSATHPLGEAQAEHGALPSRASVLGIYHQILSDDTVGN